MNIYLSENLMFDKSRNKVFQIIINPETHSSTTMSKTFFDKNVFIQTGDFRSHVDENYYEEISRILFLKNIQNQLGSIPLSNNNFRSELIKDNDNFKLSNYFKDVNPIKFISITDMAKMNEFDYANIVIFSNNKILKDIECCL
jgi:hypothetical protein